MNINPITQKGHLLYPVAAAIVGSAILSSCGSEQSHPELHNEAKRVTTLLKEELKFINYSIDSLDSGRRLPGLMLTPHNDTVYLKQHVAHLEELISILKDIDGKLDAAELLVLKDQINQCTQQTTSGRFGKITCEDCETPRNLLSNLFILIDQAIKNSAGEQNK